MTDLQKNMLSALLGALLMLGVIIAWQSKKDGESGRVPRPAANERFEPIDNTASTSTQPIDTEKREDSDTSILRLSVEFSGGYETVGVDRGRPVVLIAGALGVAPEVFRDAFSRVRPAPAGTRPTREREMTNKRVLLDALGRYGITNERLDEVSNYYRYQPGRGELWPTQPAIVDALIKNGTVTGFEVISGGSGYSSVPTIRVPGYPSVQATVRLGYGPRFESNGSISKIELL